MSSPAYGIHRETPIAEPADQYAEQIRLVGYAVVPGPWSESELADLRSRLDGIYAAQAAAAGGVEVLASIGEANTCRLLLADDDVFLGVATAKPVLDVVSRLLGDYFILNQQNGIINPPREGHRQTAYHRDLPYQHYTSSHPLAVSALLALDPFRSDNGATWMVPGSHRLEAAPAAVNREALAVQVTAPAGSFLVFDAMVFHKAGNNASDAVRRAVNHVYTIPLLKQQIDLPAALGGKFADRPDVARLLGYGATVPRSLTEWRTARLAKR
jgi:ectoine hydroxylase-related dioxygenase (phytanoyl-CoA dioxygenase family)